MAAKRGGISEKPTAAQAQRKKTKRQESVYPKEKS
jgi:hypothetical protein